MITIDNETFEVGIIKIDRKATIEKETLGQTQDGITHINAIGTRYDFIVTFATKKMNVAEYDRLYEVLTSPVNYHVVTMPYGQNTITINATISVGNDSIISNYTNFRRWGNLQVTFESLELSRTAQ